MSFTKFIKMEAKYVFDDKTKELSSGGVARHSPPGGIGKFMFDAIKEHAGNGLIAQIEGETGIEETYQDFLNKCIKLALFLKDQGLEPGDVISMCSQNTMNNTAVLIASLFVGVITSSTDPLISVGDTKHLLNLVEPKLIFVCEKSIDLIKSAVEERSTKIIALYDHDSLENVPRILEQYDENAVKSFAPIVVEDGDTTAIIMFSSGTTGLPKGTCLSHHSIGSDMSKTFSPAGTKVCGFTTLYWYSGVYFTLAGLASGMLKVNCRQFPGEKIWEFFDKNEINMIYMSYSHCMESIQHLNHTMPHLRCLCIVGGQLAVNYYKEFKEKLPNLLVCGAYGMTEIGGVSTYVGLTPPESVGLINAKDLIIRIVDPDSETPLDLNVVGEIRVKGHGQMNGYYKQDSTDCWDDKGFFKTGDLGYLDDKYQLFIVDRIKEMFKYKSWHVVPAKVEKVLSEHPAVLHGIVIGIPGEDNENYAMALVVLRDGQNVDNEELLKFVNDKVDDIHQIRAGVKFITEEDIPFTVTGKISRRKLKQMYS